MSIQGKEIALIKIKHACETATAAINNALSHKHNNYLFLLELELARIKIHSSIMMRLIQSTPAEQFNDDGTLKPLDITAKSVVMLTGDIVTREQMERLVGIHEHASR